VKRAAFVPPELPQKKDEQSAMETMDSMKIRGSFMSNQSIEQTSFLLLTLILDGQFLFVLSQKEPH